MFGFLLLAQEPGTKPSHVSRRMPSTASSPNGQSSALRIDVVSKSFEICEVEILLEILLKF